MDDQDPRASEWWRAKQLRDAEKAMRGMLSPDYGNGVRGEFVEPIIPLKPQDLKLLEYGTSSIIVSQDPAINSATVAETVQVPQRGDVGDIEDVPQEAPGVDPAAFQPDTPASSPEIPQPRLESTAGPLPSIDVYPMSEPAPAPVSVAPSVPDSAKSTPQPSSILPPDFGRRVMPGLGRSVTDPEERARIIEAARQRQVELERQQIQSVRPAANQEPEQTSSRPKTADVQPGEGAPRVSARTADTTPSEGPPKQDFGMGPNTSGSGFVPDYGSSGSTFYQDPTASQLGILSAVESAVDAIDNTSELMMELIRRLTMNVLRHGELLERLLDRVDSEDDADEF